MATTGANPRRNMSPLPSLCHPQYRRATKDGKCTSCYNKELRLRNKEYYERCKKAGREYSKTEKGKLRNKSAVLKHLYGITLVQYDEQFARQNHSCAICKRAKTDDEKRFPLDHHHVSGQVRGILCQRCNGFMSKVDIDSTIIIELLAYLRGDGNLWVKQ